MDAQKAKELKKYTRELLKDHEALRASLKAAEALASERNAEVERLTAAQAAAAAAERVAEDEGAGAPNNYLFGELCRVRERATASQVEARRLSRKLGMAEDLRAVDVARARAATSRALAEALASLRRRSSAEAPGRLQQGAERLPPPCGGLLNQKQRRRPLVGQLVFRVFSRCLISSSTGACARLNRATQFGIMQMEMILIQSSVGESVGRRKRSINLIWDFTWRIARSSRMLRFKKKERRLTGHAGLLRLSLTSPN